MERSTLLLQHSGCDSVHKRKLESNTFFIIHIHIYIPCRSKQKENSTERTKSEKKMGKISNKSFIQWVKNRVILEKK